MPFTDVITTIDYKKLVLWQDLDALAENDHFIRASLLGYRRPNLVWVSATQVEVEGNTGIENETKIVFPDMDIRSVVEDTSLADKYRRFDITSVASFNSSPEESGLRSGISEASDTWYAIYAVKSTVDATKFVLAGDTTLPLQSNYSTLNTRYGTDSWIYLGLIRNGDSDAASSDILEFVQSNGYTRFLHSSGDITGGGSGIEFDRVVNGTLDYTTTNGTGNTDIPQNITHAEFSYLGDPATEFQVYDQPGNKTYIARGDESGSTSNNHQHFWTAVASEGFLVTNGSSQLSGVAYLAGFYDGVLGPGINAEN